ncbi:hypothetical protein [Thiocapsa sp.]|uniref:hypothetical protein n=1 Tax=Thiocapsa sp. TaxID=2024551 RepID=UPI0035942C5E
MPRRQSFIDGERIRKARTLRRVEPIYEVLAQALARIPDLRFIKLFRGRLSASIAVTGSTAVGTPQA